MALGKVTFIPNPDFEREYRSSKDCHAMLLATAEKIAEVAATIAPDDPRTSAPDLHTGFRGEVISTEEGLVGRTKNINWKAGFYEFGTVRQNPRPSLVPAAESLGLEVTRE